MRTAPALRVTVGNFRLWRAAVLLLLVFCLTTGWVWAGKLGWPLAALGMALLTSAFAFAIVLAEIHRPAVNVHWDGQYWHWWLAGEDESARHTGRAEVCIDLGGWMLVRLVRAGRKPWHGNGGMHLPLQRHGMESSWHALRCAVYSPAAAGTTDSTAADQNIWIA